MRRTQSDFGPAGRYAVLWRVGDGPTVSGRLEVDQAALVVQGPREPDRLRIPFDDLLSVEVGREPSERLKDNKSVVLKRRSGDRVLLAVLGGVGVLLELADLLTVLRAEQAARMSVAVVVPIKRGMAEEALRLIAQGPPFDLEGLNLERHDVFVTEREALFIFHGENAAALIDQLARTPDMFRAAVRWRHVLAGRPRLAREGFAWVKAR